MEVRYMALTLKHGRQTVFENLRLTVPSGQIACLYGPTRSGKTSALLATGGYLKPAAGEIWLGDRQVARAPREARRLTGLGVIDSFNPLFDNLSVRENLLFQSRLFGVARPELRVARLLAELDLEAAAGKEPCDLTQPEALRAGLAMALVHDPAVVLVDEPGHALTTQELAVQWRFIEQLKQQGKTVILSSHSLWIAQHADLAVRLPQGKEVAADEFAALGLDRHHTALA